MFRLSPLRTRRPPRPPTARTLRAPPAPAMGDRSRSGAAGWAPAALGLAVLALLAVPARAQLGVRDEVGRPQVLASLQRAGDAAVARRLAAWQPAPAAGVPTPATAPAAPASAPAAFAPAPPVIAAPGALDDLHGSYGFEPFVISVFNSGIAGMLAADMDGDGRQDLVLINNAKARIDILRQRRPGEELEPFDPESINDMPDETHFKRLSYPTEQKVTALAVADLDGDGESDLAFVGDSGRLTVAYHIAGDGSGGGAEDTWGDEQQLVVDDRSSSSEALATGDLDGDGRTDLAVLGDDETALFLQGADGRLRPGPILPDATREADGLRLIDVDGDGRLDLFYVDADAEWPFRWRLGDGDASFGPERRSRLAAIRSWATADLDGDGRVELGAVRRRSGRFAVLSLEIEPEQGDLPLSTLLRLPFTRYEGSGRRESTLADLDGDGRPDLIVAEPKAARLVVWRGGEGGQFHEADTFPSLVGARQPCVADLDGDGRPEVIVAAPEEGGVGIASVDGGRVAFPRAVRVPGEDLLALDVADGNGDGRPEVWVITGEGRSRSRKHVLARLDAAGGEPATWELEDLEADPAAMMLADLDRDGHADVLAFIPGKLPALRMADGDGWRTVPVADVPGLGILKGVERAALAWGDVDGDDAEELLVPGPNFARALALDGDAVTVVAQLNLDDPAAQVGAVGLARLSGAARPEVLLVEKGKSQLHVLQMDDEGASSTLAVVELDELTPNAVLAADLDADGRIDLVLPAADELGLVLHGGLAMRYVPEREYELPVKGSNLDRIAFGDVNGDGQPEVVLTETNKHMVAIAAIGPDEIEHALKFPVFEERVFQQGRGGREPRELLLADLTGDGLLDVVIIVHDRVIVYPQD